METLTGKLTLSLTKEDGSTITAEVSQIKLRDYERAFLLTDDEFAITAIASGLTKSQVLDLIPKDYEQLCSAVKEVNKDGFFAYSARRFAQVMDKMSRVSPEVIKLAAERPSTTSPVGLLPR